MAAAATDSLQRRAGGDLVGVKISRSDPEMQAGFPAGIKNKSYPGRMPPDVPEFSERGLPAMDADRRRK